jgi:hypothetical protein
MVYCFDVGDSKNTFFAGLILVFLYTIDIISLLIKNLFFINQVKILKGYQQQIS